MMKTTAKRKQLDATAQRDLKMKRCILCDDFQNPKFTLPDHLKKALAPCLQNVMKLKKLDSICSKTHAPVSSGCVSHLSVLANVMNATAKRKKLDATAQRDLKMKRCIFDHHPT